MIYNDESYKMIRNLKIKNKNNHRVWFLLFLLTLNITFPMGNNFLLSLTKCLCPDVDHLYKWFWPVVDWFWHFYEQIKSNNYTKMYISALSGAFINRISSSRVSWYLKCPVGMIISKNNKCKYTIKLQFVKISLGNFFSEDWHNGAPTVVLLHSIF